MGTTIVSCPVATAKQLAEKGCVFIGWTSARIVALEPRPMRCFRCMAIGHTSPLCPSTKALLPLRGSDHKIGNCTAEKF